MVLPIRSSVAVTPGRSCARATAGAASMPAAAASTCRLPSMLLLPATLDVRALDHIAEADPGFPVPALQLHVPDRVVIGGRGADLHARQQGGGLERGEVG